MPRGETRGSVITSGSLEKVLALVVIVDTSEETDESIVIEASGHCRQDVAIAVRADKVEVGQILGKQVLSCRSDTLAVPVFDVGSDNSAQVMSVIEGVIIRGIDVIGIILACTYAFFQVILTGACLVIFHLSVRISAERHLDLPVGIPVLVDPVSEIGGHGHLLDRGDLQFRHIREVGLALNVIITD